jgi:phage gp29-like protein
MLTKKPAAKKPAAKKPAAPAVPPTDRVIVMNPVDELPSLVRSVTADRLMSIIGQAENGDTRDLFGIYRDIIASDNQVQTEFGKRKAAVLGDTVNMVPWDKQVPADVDAKNRCWRLVDMDPFQDAENWLLNASLYPVSVAEKVFRPAGAGYILDSVVPVHYQLLDYRTGALRIFDVDPNGRALSTSHDPDPNRYIVHRGHTLPLPDQWGGPMRAILFWWLLRTMSRQWWADLLERFGVPFLKGKYSDEDGRAVLERAFRLAVKMGAIVVSKGTEVEVVQATAGDASSSHERFIELCNREISKLIVGQTLSSNVQSTGMGEGTSKLQGQVRDDLRKMDARMLANTLRSQLLTQFCRINGETGAAPVLLFGSDSSAELTAMMGLVESLGKAGFEPDDDGMVNIAERVGFGIRRKAAMPTLPFNAVGLNAQVSDKVAPSLAADLSAAFTGRLAPVARIISHSESPEDCIRKVRVWALSAHASDVPEILEQALSAYAASGSKSATR